MLSDQEDLRVLETRHEVFLDDRGLLLFVRGQSAVEHLEIVVFGKVGFGDLLKLHQPFLETDELVWDPNDFDDAGDGETVAEV